MTTPMTLADVDLIVGEARANATTPDLQYADLRYADLRDADLRDADLRGVNLRGVNLRYANLRNANLRYADLQYADLQYADLRYADLWYANLRNANLRYANLRYADLRNANLRYADVWDADFQYANLSGTSGASGVAISVTGRQNADATGHSTNNKGKKMGDRANFGIKQHNGHTIVIYGHWAGWEMLHHFAVALKTAKDAGRIYDESYAARIIFDSLTEGSDPLLGWGITVDCIQDNEHKVPVFDVDSQTVSLYDCGCSFNLDNPIFTMSVDGFISKFLKQG